MVVRDGLRLILMFYRNHRNLRLVEQNTGVPVEKLTRFCDGEDCLTPEEDAKLRKPLDEFGGKVEVH